MMGGGGGGHAHFEHLPKLSIPPMNALEILRETVRILRADPSTFSSILLLLFVPVSFALLSNAFLDSHLIRSLARRLLLLAVSSGLPSTHFLHQICHHLAGTIVTSAICFPLIITLLLLARSAVSYAVACVYANKDVLTAEFILLARRIWRRVVVTYLCTCIAISGCAAAFLMLLVVVCNLFAAMMYPPEVIVYVALVVVLGFSVIYAHTVIVCNIAGVITVLEEVAGMKAMVQSVRLVRGQTQAGLLIFLGSTIGMAFVEGLFEHRVKTLSYGDGSSRLWEGPLLVLMYSFVGLVDSMMSVVFYFTCRSSSMDLLGMDGDGDEFVEEQELLASESAVIK